MNIQNNIHVLSRAVIIDQEHLLLCKTFDLPINLYFLPGGHVEHGESVEASLLRELFEEAATQAHIKRFLGCLEYILKTASNRPIVVFATTMNTISFLRSNRTI